MTPQTGAEVKAEIKEYMPGGGDQVMIWVNDRDTRRGGYCLECVPRHVAPVLAAALMTTPHHSEPAREAVDARKIKLPNGYYLFQHQPSDMTCSLHMPDGLHIGNLRAEFAGDFVASLSASPAPAASGGLEAVREAAKAGWNACRKSIYAVCEDVVSENERHREDTENPPRHHFGRGGMTAAKSIARGFNAMEAEDDDNFTAALAALAAPAATGGEAVAWMDDGSTRAGSHDTEFRVVTARTKANMPKAAAVAYTKPLYTHPAPSETGARLGVKAQITPFSSVVGQSVLLLDDDGAALAHLSISIPNPEKPYRETAEEVARIIELAINQPPSEEVKRLRVRLADLMLADAKRKAGR